MHKSASILMIALLLAPQHRTASAEPPPAPVYRDGSKDFEFNARRMNRPPRTVVALLVSAALSLAWAAPAVRDGAGDFDWEIGHWKTVVKRRLHPLAGSDEWARYEGTTVVRKLWDGRANIVELDVSGPAGRIEGASWRLYNPQARQWSLNFANVRSGTLAPPTIGEFKDGRGEFYASEVFDGRAILTRFEISIISEQAAHFEQAFSADGGKTWEVNWIADDTRVK